MVTPNLTPPILTEQEIARFWSKVLCTEGCWEWQAGRRTNGYGMMTFKRLNRNISAHRLAYFLTYEIWPNEFVLHHCDTRHCVKPEHLFLGSHTDNMADMVAKGRSLSGDRHNLRRHPELAARGDRSSARKYPERHLRGDRSWLAKYTEAVIREVFSLKRLGHTGKHIAKTLGMSETNVSSILRGKTWAHLGLYKEQFKEER